MLGSFEQSCTMPRQGLRPALVAACLLLNLLWTVFPPQVIQDNSELIVFCREFTMFCRELILFCLELMCILPWVYFYFAVTFRLTANLFCCAASWNLFCRDFVSPLHLWATVLSITCNMLPQQNVALKIALCTLLHEATFNATLLR